MSTRRMCVGAAGEELAVRFLEGRGVEVLGRNLRVGREEVDLVVRIGGRPVIVEVKTGVGEGTRPWEWFDAEKERRVRRAAAALRIGRVDLIAVEFTREGAIVRWLPGVG